jgi:hypothetical protein
MILDTSAARVANPLTARRLWHWLGPRRWGKPWVQPEVQAEVMDEVQGGAAMCSYPKTSAAAVPVCVQGQAHGHMKRRTHPNR